MSFRMLTAVALSALLAACGKPESAAPATPETATVETAAAETAAAETTLPEVSPFDASAAPSGVYANDPDHSYVVFTYNHMGYSHPVVRWGKWTSELSWDKDAPERSTVSATIDVSSIDTGSDRLDGHLRSADFFDAETYPTITFNSTGLTVTGPDTATMTGDLTIKDVTKPVSVDVKINRAADDGFAKAYKLGFSAKGEFRRSDFGVDLYVPMVSDDISFTIETEFALPKEPVEQ